MGFGVRFSVSGLGFNGLGFRVLGFRVCVGQFVPCTLNRIRFLSVHGLLS